MRKIFIIALSFLLSSCLSYTSLDGISKIELPRESTIATRLVDVKEEREAQAILDEERKLEELKAQAELERLEQERIAEEKAKKEAEEEAYRKSLTIDYPEVDKLVLPHEYIVNHEFLTIDNDFSQISVLFLPLGSTPYTDDEMLKLADSIRDLDYTLTVLTGDAGNNIRLANLLNHNSAYVNGGLVISELEISEINETITYKLNDEKTFELAVMNMSRSFNENTDIDALIEILDSQKETSSALLEDKLSKLSNQNQIFAFSSTEPSHEDWNVFTPVEYREDYNWSLSNILSEYDDAYLETHYTNEVDLGITYTNGKIRERLDFLYSKNLMIVDSETITLPTLYEKGISAVAANYIIP